MAWSYRKRIKVIPGVHLNFSNSGISTSIGVRGASVNFGKNGTYLNTSIPGLGHNRQKLSDGSKPIPATYFDQPTPYTDNIFSADIQEITSQDMQGIKEAIIAAHEQRLDLRKDLASIKASLGSSKFKLFASYMLLYGVIKKSIANNIKTEINAKKDAIKELEKQIENCYVALDIEFDQNIKERYDRMVESFKKLSTSMKIWDVTSENYQNRVATRSAASTVVNKRAVKFGIKSLPDLKSAFETLWLKNANGADLYFYPNFIVMYSNQKQFALIGLHEINFYHNAVRFIETGSVPGDSKIIDRTWAKVNKNGTPDKRFKDNYQIPVVRYGEITLNTATGLNEQYEFSNFEYSEEFATAFNNYQQTIKYITQITA
ncbi:hypothetical protein A4D02_13905 [Niastella koreensis]|uniref:DUF4236 domain-containing protein n=2 Tax=Niastella koreensis TaxID=354356 RepID=G8TQ49_NIAKG|nr:DUF4236 domain-containing protein [Niastella koreensis]AEW01050.1 hypothetical protein Niako_4800 [Niastella koreensis GR20-10]OQP42654.1 hypothetical protein A4D02_13905 [Niastella koreensis]